MTLNDSLSAEARDHVAGYLNRLPFVRWDRMAGDADYLVVYGWIVQEGSSIGRSDFVVLDFADVESLTLPGSTTSSADRSVEVHDLLYGEASVEDHRPCERVEDVLAWRVDHAIELAR